MARPARWDKERPCSPRGTYVAQQRVLWVIRSSRTSPTRPRILWDMRNSVKAFRQLIWLETFRLLELRIFRRWIVSQTEHAIAIGPRLKSTCSASSMRMPLITGIFLVGQRKTSGRMSRQCRHQSAVPQRHLTLRDERRTLDDAEARRNGRRSRHQSFPMRPNVLRTSSRRLYREAWEDRAGLCDRC